jgi:hypothetical protein
MPYEYGTAYDGDTFSKLINDLKIVLDAKSKRKDEIYKLLPWPETTDQEKAISEFISNSIIEGKDLEIFHDRLVQLAEKLD